MTDDITDYLGAALALEARMGEQNSQTTERAMQHAVTALRIAHENRGRLAALAGAAPVAWYVELVAPGFIDNGTKLGLTWKKSEAEEWAGESRIVRELYDHAPAKAREVAPVDVERACIAHYEDWNRFHQHEREAFRRAMRAALATFAEGSE